MMKRTLTAAALAAVLAAPAFAQSNPPAATPTPNMTAASQGSFVQNQDATDWRSSKLVGSSVYGPDNASIGEVNDVLIGNDGKIRAVVIGVGGFLGVGGKNVAVPLESLNISRKPDSSTIDKISVSYSKDELKAAPSFAFYEPAASQTTGAAVTDKLKSLNPMGTSSTNK